MELHLPLHRWEGRQPDVRAAVVAGLAAGAVLMVVELAWAALSTTEAPWRIAQLVAALILGPTATLHGSAQVFDPMIVGVALVTHYLLGIGGGLMVAAFMAGYRIDQNRGAVLVVGVLFGLLLYLFNFYALTEAFTWFVELRGWATMGSHLVFGVTAAWLYSRLATPTAD